MLDINFLMYQLVVHIFFKMNIDHVLGLDTPSVCKLGGAMRHKIERVVVEDTQIVNQQKVNGAIHKG